jgi:hypothetical protein
MKDDEKDFSFAGTITAASAKALKINTGQGDDIWVPKSQIDDSCVMEGVEGENVDLIIPVWLAKKKGLIQDEATEKPDDIPF